MSWQLVNGEQMPVITDTAFDLVIADKVFPGHDWSSRCKCNGDCLPPTFSTDLESAYEIVEKLKGEGFAFGLFEVPSISSVSPAPVAVFKKSVYPPEWRVDLSWPEPERTDVFAACADKPALAICLAALKAKAHV